MNKKIDQKIIHQGIKTIEPISLEKSAWKQLMSEHMERPTKLIGSTYKIKTPNTDHAVYLTINDMILNPGTEYEERHPYEIFINSKDMTNFQWIVIMTRLVSAIFRKGGDITFMIEEMKNTFDPKRGYIKKGIQVPSLVADIGYTIEEHFKHIGLIK